jgi:hypothetical protein
MFHLLSKLTSSHFREDARDATRGEQFEAQQEAYIEKVRECKQRLEMMAPTFGDEACIFQEAILLCETIVHQYESHAEVDLHAFLNLTSACEATMYKCIAQAQQSITEASRYEAEAKRYKDKVCELELGADEAHHAETTMKIMHEIAHRCRDEARKHELKIPELENIRRTCRIEADEEEDEAHMHAAKAGEYEDIAHNYEEKKLAAKMTMRTYVGIACIDRAKAHTWKVELVRGCGKYCKSGECRKIIKEINAHKAQAREMEEYANCCEAEARAYKTATEHLQIEAAKHKARADAHQTEARQCKDVADICETKMLQHQAHARECKTVADEYEAKARKLEAQVHAFHQHQDSTAEAYQLETQTRICTSKASEWKMIAAQFEVCTHEFKMMARNYQASMGTPPTPTHQVDEHGCIN